MLMYTVSHTLIYTVSHVDVHCLTRCDLHCLTRRSTGPQTIEYFQQHAPKVEDVEPSVNPAEFIVDLTTKVLTAVHTTCMRHMDAHGYNMDTATCHLHAVSTG